MESGIRTGTNGVISPQEALELVLKHTPVLGRQMCPLAHAVERVLASDIRARDSLPPFDSSAMDGYAVRARDLRNASPQKPVDLRICDTIRAGAPRALRLEPGQAAKIMTGAPLPPGADSVVMQEHAQPRDDGRVGFSLSCRIGSHIRAAGEDVRAKCLLLKAGALLRPYEIALLAAQGITEIPVIKRPRAAVLATGDELSKPSAKNLAPGRIRNSNGPALLAALSRWNIPALDLGIARDEPRKIQSVLARALRKSDLVVVSGGVSVGDFDFTKTIFQNLGIREICWRVAIKPGKPLLFGVYERPGARPKIVFGLPGNPIASLVCLEEFVRPALEKLQGHRLKHGSYHLLGQTLNDYPKPKERQQYLFCRAKPGPKGYDLHIIRPQGSAMLGMAAQANALAIAPIGLDRVPKGDTLAFRWLK